MSVYVVLHKVKMGPCVYWGFRFRNLSRTDWLGGEDGFRSEREAARAAKAAAQAKGWVIR